MKWWTNVLSNKKACYSCSRIFHRYHFNMPNINILYFVHVHVWRLREILQKFSNDCSWQVAKHVNKIDNQLQLSVHIQHNTNHVNYQITHRLTDCFIIIRADCLLSLIIWHINSSKLFCCKWHIFDMMYAVLVFHSQKCQFLKVTTKKSPLMVLLTSIVIYMRMLTQLRI